MTKATKPYKGFSLRSVTQGFHSGHKAIDCVKGYGTPLVAPERVRIDEIRTPDRITNDTTGLKNGYGIWMIGQETGNYYLYWHCLPVFPVWAGDLVERGQIVAYMGNSGHVYQGGAYVPINERNIPPHRGTHLHWSVQKGNVPIDPLMVTDVDSEPAYNKLDELSSYIKSLAKIAKLLAKGNL